MDSLINVPGLLILGVAVLGLLALFVHFCDRV